MASTYTPIETQTLGSSQASVTFSNVSQAYTDLVLIVNTTSSTSAGLYLQVGNTSIDTGANYSYTYMYGNGSAASSGREVNQNTIYCADQGTTTRQSTIIQIQNYSNSTTNKTILSRAGLPNVSTSAIVGMWRSTSPIKELKFINGNFNAGSTFTLYGILAA